MIWDTLPPFPRATVEFSSLRFGDTCEIFIGHLKIMRAENLIRKWYFDFFSSRGVIYFENVR